MNNLNLHIRLKTARKELQLNQLQIANDLNIQQKTISEIENGKILNIPNSYIYYFYKKGISLDWLYDEMGEMFLKAGDKKEQTPQENAQLNELIDKTSSKQDTVNIPDENILIEGANTSLYERLIESKDLTIKSLLAYIKSLENNLEFVKDLLDK